MRAFLIFFTMTVASVCAFAAELTQAEQDRANALFKQIRCPTCTAQPVSESDASLSVILRDRIEKAITTGQSDQQILADLTTTYGDDIRLLPKTETRTLPLWLAPWLIILLGSIGIVLNHRRKSKT